jgi:hypothetical protein
MFGFRRGLPTQQHATVCGGEKVRHSSLLVFPLTVVWRSRVVVWVTVRWRVMAGNQTSLGVQVHILACLSASKQDVQVIPFLELL